MIVTLTTQHRDRAINQEPLYNYSIHWHPGECPTSEQMTEAGRSCLSFLQLDEYAASLSVHTEQPACLKVKLDRIHPITGKTASVQFHCRSLGEWSEQYEREHPIPELS